MLAATPVTLGSDGCPEYRWETVWASESIRIRESGFEQVPRTEQPRLASWRATARPMPLVAPLMFR
jgi:hypothetical protein